MTGTVIKNTITNTKYIKVIKQDVFTGKEREVKYPIHFKSVKRYYNMGDEVEFDTIRGCSNCGEIHEESILCSDVDGFDSIIEYAIVNQNKTQNK